MRILQLVVVAVLLATAPIVGSQQTASLKIVVIEGEDAVNIVQQRTAVQPIVEVRDRNNLPVAGALVTFSVGGGGAASFSGGLTTVGVVTDATGRAVVTGLQPASNGAFSINVSATYQGQTATTSITQTNFATAAEAAQAGKVPSQSSASNAGSSSASSGGSGASGAAGAGGAGAAGAGAAAAGGGAAAAGGGLSAVAIGGIVGGAAVGGLVAVRAATGGNGDDPGSSGPNCTAQENAVNNANNTLINSLNAFVACASNAVTPGQLTACETPVNTQIQNVLTAASNLCTCLGPNFAQQLTPEERAQVADAFNQLRSLGFNVGALPSCYR